MAIPATPTAANKRTQPPALLSGVEPHPGRAPVGANYPTLILNLFSDSHEVFASEASTQLCDGENCAGTVERSVGVGLLIEDTGVYLADAVLPFYANDAVRRLWSHFRSGAEASGQDVSPSVEIVAGGWDAETEAARLVLSSPPNQPATVRLSTSSTPSCPTSPMS